MQEKEIIHLPPQMIVIFVYYVLSNGVLHVMSCKILEDLVKVLLPCHLETRASSFNLIE
jgi:hypothetical protein